MEAQDSDQGKDFDSAVAGFHPKQLQALDALDSGKVKFLLYGGAMGGGKSRFLRWICVRFLMDVFGNRGIRNCQVMLACEDYPALKDRQLSKIAVEFPAWLGKGHADHKDFGRCFILSPAYGSGVICFRNLDDASKYMSAEFALIAVDELTKNPYEVFTNLRTRIRWSGLTDMECPFVAGTNPGGIGHAWVKQFWMDHSFPSEWIRPIDYSKTFAYIPSLADDNPFLDSSYWQSLETLPEALRKAFRYGDWNTFVGQAFPELSEFRHGYDSPGAPPEGVFLLQSLDWGFGKPFSVGWWHTDSDGRLYRFAEWYGFNGMADQGLRLADPDIAAGIRQREEEMGIWGKPILRKAGPDCFAKKPDYKGGGQGPSTAEVFREAGIILTPGDPNRQLKIRQFRNRLRVPEDGQIPMMLIARSCKQFWRTVPALVIDENNLEDVDTKGEDHVYDEVALACMARPIAIQPEIKVIKRPPATGSEAAWREHKTIMDEVLRGGEPEW